MSADTSDSETKVGSFERPYFFEEHFPSSYSLKFAIPVKRHRGKLEFDRDELEKVSSCGKDGFAVYIDVKDYGRDELSVRIVNELIIVAGKRRPFPGSYHPRQFSREFKLPEFCDPESVTSFISDDGILGVKAAPLHKAHTNGGTGIN